jgi:hypothetical protein
VPFGGFSKLLRNARTRTLLHAKPRKSRAKKINVLQSVAGASCASLQTPTMPPRLPTTTLLRVPLARTFSTARPLLAPTNPLSNESDGTPRTGPRILRNRSFGGFMGDTRDDAAQRARHVMTMLSEHQTTSTPSSSAGASDEFSLQELSQSQLRFQQGDIYAPNDLTMEELRARRKNRRPVKDAFDVLGINPLTQYKVRLPAPETRLVGRWANYGCWGRTTISCPSMSRQWEGSCTPAKRD